MVYGSLNMRIFTKLPYCQVDLNLLLMQILYFHLDTEASTHDSKFHLKVHYLNAFA